MVDMVSMTIRNVVSYTDEANDYSIDVDNLKYMIHHGIYYDNIYPTEIIYGIDSSFTESAKRWMHLMGIKLTKKDVKL